MRVGYRALVVLGWVACAPSIPPLPSRGGPAWSEVQSEHFTLWTDASAQRGRELVREMERRRQVIVTAMNSAGRRTRTFVIALRDRIETGEYLPLDAAASAWDADNPTGEPGILLAADDDEDLIVINHEVAHVISHEVIRHQPAWLAEGLATYFDIFAPDPDRGGVRIGIPHPDRLRRLRRQNPLPTAQLFACEQSRCRDNKFYATSWGVVSLLLARHRDLFLGYLQRLNERAHDRSNTPWYLAIRDLPQDEQQRRRQDERTADADAWQDAFPDLTPDRLDRELWQWIVAGEHVLPTIQVTVTARPATERTLGDAEVLAARAWLRWRLRQPGNADGSDAAAALALDRTNVLAHLVEAAITHAVSSDEARAAAAAHPDDWRALRLVELALHGTPEGDAALHRLCAMTADSAPECWRPRTGP